MKQTFLSNQHCLSSIDFRAVSSQVPSRHGIFPPRHKIPPGLCLKSSPAPDSYCQPLSDFHPFSLVFFIMRERPARALPDTSQALMCSLCHSLRTLSSVLMCSMYTLSAMEGRGLGLETGRSGARRPSPGPSRELTGLLGTLQAGRPQLHLTLIIAL